MRVTKAFYPLLNKSEHPVIANITSLMGSIEDNSSGGNYAYRMSKAALNMFTKTLSVEFKKAVVLSLHPGWVKTDMGGSGATTETSESAAGLLKVIRESSPKSSGHFFNFKGQPLHW
jgi:NAD(P)-dependent dehydrogenase (short-subunit alcohol dehydrogenase family)